MNKKWLLVVLVVAVLILGYLWYRKSKNSKCPCQSGDTATVEQPSTIMDKFPEVIENEEVQEVVESMG